MAVVYSGPVNDAAGYFKEFGHVPDELRCNIADYMPLTDSQSSLLTSLSHVMSVVLQVVYSGPVYEAASYFKDLGFVPDELRSNVADYMLDLAIRADDLHVHIFHCTIELLGANGW